VGHIEGKEEMEADRRYSLGQVGYSIHKPGRYDDMESKGIEAHNLCFGDICESLTAGMPPTFCGYFGRRPEPVTFIPRVLSPSCPSFGGSSYWYGSGLALQEPGVKLLIFRWRFVAVAAQQV
jgi:hypothetical protein